ncbi:hypothetical protein [Wenyingzhuangia aestuarii]|uniref:hypothetical protein n=1 Tax=Wenyingzhuangia aestuarii TaxID=1647582 RepID=UPI00143BE5B7|nr:hypothetical protein [Wenyingzhuangia aestuarii]NJB82309.1 hypothetical protein [Wenyingzhuangia aestuarii]
MKFFLSISMFLLMVIGVRAQDLGPGGVGSTASNGSDYMIWLRADKDVDISNLNSVGLQWSDLSGKGNLYTPHGPSKTPKFEANNTNGMPAIVFDNKAEKLYSDPINGQISQSTHTIILVWNSNESNPAKGRRVFSTNGGYELSVSTNRKNFEFNFPSGSPKKYSFGKVKEYLKPTITFISRTADNKLKIYKNGALESTTSISDSNHFKWTSNMSIMFGDLDYYRTSHNKAIKQNIYEVIHSREDFDAEIVDKILIENYLSAKYDIDLEANDVYKGDDIGYDYDVAGIGKDTNNNSRTSAKGTGIIAVSNPSDLDKNEYLIWGKNKINDYSFEEVSGAKRLNAVWAASSRTSNGNNKADIGTVTVSVKLSDLDFGTDKAPTDFKMLVSSKSGFETVDHIYTASIANGVATFTGVDLQDADYFTFQYPITYVYDSRNGGWSPKEPTDSDVFSHVVIKRGLARSFNDFSTSKLEIQYGGGLILTGANVTVKGEVVIADSDRNSLLILADGSQLIQTHSGENKNSGTNFYISFTPPAKNIYSYSYISSPVSQNKLNYSFSESLKDGRISPLLGTNFYYDDKESDGVQESSKTTMSTEWMNSYFNNGSWKMERSTGAVPIGQGLAIKEPGTLAQTYVAKGIPNSGDYEFTVSSYSTSLLGNPYPSALDANKFLDDNSNIVDALYFYEDKSKSHYTVEYQGGYGVYTRYGGGVAASVTVNGEKFEGKIPTRYIPVGQGFMVSTPTDIKGKIQFKNSQRVIRKIGSASKFFKTAKLKTLKTKESSDDLESLLAELENETGSSPVVSEEPVPQNETTSLRLGFEFNVDDATKFHRQIGVNFKEGNSFGDRKPGYYAELYDENPTDIYIEHNKNKYVLASAGSLSEETEIPLKVVLEKDSNVAFMLDGTNNIDEEVFLKDKELATSESLKNQKVNKTLTSGVYNDRFSLIFKQDKELSTKKINASKVNVQVHQKTITVSSDEYNITGLSIIDFTGKTVKTSNSSSIDVFGISSKIIILKIESKEGVLVKKMFL